MTGCIPLGQEYEGGALDNLLERSALNEVQERLLGHWRDTLPSTNIEPRYDAVFGIALYCLRVLEEMLGMV